MSKINSNFGSKKQFLSMKNNVAKREKSFYLEPTIMILKIPYFSKIKNPTILSYVFSRLWLAFLSKIYSNKIDGVLYTMNIDYTWSSSVEVLIICCNNYPIHVECSFGGPKLLQYASPMRSLEGPVILKAGTKSVIKQFVIKFEEFLKLFTEKELKELIKIDVKRAKYDCADSLRLIDEFKNDSRFEKGISPSLKEFAFLYGLDLLKIKQA